MSFYIVLKLHFKNMIYFALKFTLLYWEKNFNSSFKISRHPVSTSTIYFWHTIVFKVENSTMFKEITDNGANGYIIGYSFNSRSKTAYSAYNQINIYALTRCFIKGIYYFLEIMDLMIFVRIILSWFVDPFSRIMQTMVIITEPFVAPVRNIMARIMRSPMRLDFSPIIASLLIAFLQRLVVIIFM